MLSKNDVIIQANNLVVELGYYTGTHIHDVYRDKHIINLQMANVKSGKDGAVEKLYHYCKYIRKLYLSNK